MEKLILLPPDTMQDVPGVQRRFRLMFCGQEIPGLVSLRTSQSGRGDTVLIEILQDCIEVVPAPTILQKPVPDLTK